MKNSRRKGLPIQLAPRPRSASFSSLSRSSALALRLARHPLPTRSARSPLAHQPSVAPTPSLTAWIVTFLVLYMRFMVMPLNARTILLQTFIIIILLVLPSDPEYFRRKFVMSRIAILLILAFGTELE